MTEALFRERQREALRKLIELTADRGRLESSIVQQHETDGRANQEEYERRISELRASREAELTSAQATFDDERSRIESGIEAKHRKTELEYQAEKERTADKAQANLQVAEKRRQEAIWATETVYEAQKDQPAKRYEKQCESITHANEKLQACLDESTAFLTAIFISTPPLKTPDTSETTSASDESDAKPDSQEDDRDIETLLTQVHDVGERGDALAKNLGDQWSAKLLSGIRPFVFLLTLSVVGAGINVAQYGGTLDQRLGFAAGGGAGLALVILIVCYVITRKRSRVMVQNMRSLQEDIRTLGRIVKDKAVRQRDLDEAELLEKRDNEIRAADDVHRPIHEEVTQRLKVRQVDLEEAYSKRNSILDDRLKRQIGDLQQQYDERTTKVSTRSDDELKQVTDRHARGHEEIENRYETDWSSLESRWHNGMRDIMETIQEINREEIRLFPDWNDGSWKEWTPTLVHAPAIRFGEIAVDRRALEGGLPVDERLAFEAPDRITLPASLVFPHDCSLLFEFGDHGRKTVVATMQNIMMRLLTSLPPGKVRFTIIDPVGLGESFAGFMHLTDFDEQLVGSRIWTESRHIEQRLADLTEHIENVIQKYLRNEFETIAQYNEKAGEISEPYRFLVISDLPAGFTEVAARRLASIISSGARCGLYTLIGLDTRQKMPPGLELADLRQYCLNLVFEKDTYYWEDDDYREFPLTLDAPPGDSVITETLQRVGKAAKESSRVEVPFEVITPPVDAYWSLSTATEVNVPLGRAGATKLQHLILGHGTSQHVLIAGKTGSGKSTLLHALITNLALLCSPDEIEFYLVDFKKGVEFKSYATHQLPHARVIAIESDREFGLSVLQRVDAELRRRGRIFRDLEVQDLAGFRKARPDQPMPRVLLIIDEFQEFFTEDDKVAQDGSLLLDRLVRQGRAFGIHVLLGSQTLGGAYSLARSTVGQMAIRIALQCSEADSYLILSDDNSAARLLSRPGEAIYNDASGMVEGNNPFQTAWVSDAVRDDYLTRIKALADERGYEPPERQVVFEGNVPADVDRNNLLNQLLSQDTWPEATPAAYAWLGDAIAIKDPTAITFRRQSGSNMLIVGQRDESALAMMAMSLISLAVQYEPNSVRFVILDGSPADSPHAGFLEKIAAMLPHETHVVGWREVEEALGEISAECDRRQEEDETSAPAVFLIIFGLQRYRMLRQSEDFSFSMDDSKPAGVDKLFSTIIREGPNFGIHTLLWSDTLTNLERVLDRAGMREFDNRVLFQMSATDSTNLIDAPAASKMGIRRALLYNEEQGQLEKFRPYALPDEGWLQNVQALLGNRMVVDR